MDKEDFIRLVYQNLKNEISSKDKSALNELSLSNDDLAVLRTEIEDAWDLAGETPIITSKKDKEKGFAKLQTKIAELDLGITAQSAISRDNLRVVGKTEIEEEEASLPVVPKFARVRFYRTLLGGVAACLLLISAFWLFVGDGSDYYEGGLSGLEIELADQSIVFLSPHSSLKVEKFEQTRSMKLEGRAKFNVVRSQDSKKFIVYTENSRTEVMGTSFVISEVSSLSKVVLQVEEGRVKFSDKNEGSTIIVKAQESAEVDSDSAVRKIDYIRNLIAEPMSVLRFDAERLEKVVSEIIVIFNRNIIVENEEMKSCQLAAAIPAKDLEAVLSHLVRQFGFELVKTETNWILKGGECK